MLPEMASIRALLPTPIHPREKHDVTGLDGHTREVNVKLLKGGGIPLKTDLLILVEGDLEGLADLSHLLEEGAVLVLSLLWDNFVREVCLHTSGTAARVYVILIERPDRQKKIDWLCFDPKQAHLEVLNLPGLLMDLLLKLKIRGIPYTLAGPGRLGRVDQDRALLSGIQTLLFLECIT